MKLALSIAVAMSCCASASQVAYAAPYALTFKAIVSQVRGLSAGENGPQLGSEIRGFMNFSDHDLDEFPDDFSMGEYHTFDAGIELVALYYDPYLAGILSVNLMDEAVQFRIYDGWPGSHYQFDLRFKAPGLSSDRFPAHKIADLSLVSITGSYKGFNDNVHIDMSPLYLSLGLLSPAPEPESLALFAAGSLIAFGAAAARRSANKTSALNNPSTA